MNDLIPIGRAAVEGETVPTVNARALHEFLGVGRDFSTWLKARIEQYGFTAGSDFVVAESLSTPNPGSAMARAQRTVEYHLTLDMAKELAMVENTDEGKEARRYFIDCEKRACPKSRRLEEI